MDLEKASAEEMMMRLSQVDWKPVFVPLLEQSIRNLALALPRNVTDHIQSTIDKLENNTSVVDDFEYLVRFQTLLPPYQYCNGME